MKRACLIWILFVPLVGEAQFPVFLEADVSWSPPPISSIAYERSDAQPVLDFIPGAVFGKPGSGLPTLPIASRGSSQIQFPLFLLSGFLEGIATTITSEAQISGLRVDPEATRFFRAATFFLMSEERHLLGAGFGEVDSAYLLLLIYVDRPSQFSGSFSSGDIDLTYEFSFDSAGFHWVRGVPTGGALTNAQPDIQISFLSSYPSEAPAK